MPTRNSEAVWEGDLKGGKGTVTLGSGAYTGPYSFQSRFEQGTGTNPEELIAAAHAGCFSMALSHALAGAGYPPRRVHTTAKVHLEKAGDGPSAHQAKKAIKATPMTAGTNQPDTWSARR